MMNIRYRNLLALAVAGVLATPIALAQGQGPKKDANPTTGTTVSDAVRSEGPVSDTTATTDQTVAQTARQMQAPPTTSNDAADITQDDATSNDAVDTAQSTSNDAAGTTQETTTRKDKDATPPRDAHERMVKNPTNTEESDRDKTPPVPPVQSQGAANAATHASVTQRELFGRLDTDNDGQISAAESAVDAEFNAGFQAMDGNDDGLVTGDEYQVAARADLGSGQSQGGVNAASHSTASVRDLMGRLDTNADGSISVSEAQADAGFNAGFAAADANSDGMVSSQEYQAWVKAQRK
jgi:Ca2+-binding EF-hand superfamily protein